MNGNKLEVWIDADFIGEMIKIETLAKDGWSVRFNYDHRWLEHPRCFNIDPHLFQDNSVFHPDPGAGNFGIFMDSSPDRWGQTLMKRGARSKRSKTQTKKPLCVGFLARRSRFNSPRRSSL